MTPFYSSVSAKPKQAVYAGMTTSIFDPSVSAKPKLAVNAWMSRSILIMAGGTGGHIFAFGITPAVRVSALSENMANSGAFQ